MTKRTPLLESRIEKVVTAYARKLGWLAYKFASPSQRGVPDHIYMRRGDMFFIEFKREGKKPTKLQAHTHQKIRDEGGFLVYTVDSVEQGKFLLDNLEDD